MRQLLGATPPGVALTATVSHQDPSSPGAFPLTDQCNHQRKGVKEAVQQLGDPFALVPEDAVNQKG